MDSDPLEKSRIGKTATDKSAEKTLGNTNSDGAKSRNHKRAIIPDSKGASSSSSSSTTAGEDEDEDGSSLPPSLRKKLGISSDKKAADLASASDDGSLASLDLTLADSTFKTQGDAASGAKGAMGKSKPDTKAKSKVELKAEAEAGWRANAKAGLPSSSKGKSMETDADEADTDDEKHDGDTTK